MTAPAADVRDLLAAISEALDVPLAARTREYHRELNLRTFRATTVRAHLHDMATGKAEVTPERVEVAARLIRRSAENYPVDYETPAEPGPRSGSAGLPPVPAETAGGGS